MELETDRETETEMKTETGTEILACVITVYLQTSTMLPGHWTGFLDLNTQFIQTVIIPRLVYSIGLFIWGWLLQTFPGTDITVIIVMRLPA